MPKPSPEQMKANFEKMMKDIMGHIEGEPGWGVMFIFGEEDEPPFCYTVGLEKNFKHPELIMYGLPPEQMHWALNQYGNKVKNGHAFKDGETENDLFSLPFTFRECNAGASRLLGVANQVYKGEKFRVMQVYWPDKEGVFPWEKGFDTELTKHQPVWTIDKTESPAQLQ